MWYACSGTSTEQKCSVVGHLAQTAITRGTVLTSKTILLLHFTSFSIWQTTGQSDLARQNIKFKVNTGKLFFFPAHTKSFSSEQQPEPPTVPKSLKKKKLKHNLGAKLIATLNSLNTGVALRQRQITCLQTHHGLKRPSPPRQKVNPSTRLVRSRLPVSFWDDCAIFPLQSFT